MTSEYQEGIPAKLASLNGRDARPFWKTMPRYESEYRTTDLVRAMAAIFWESSPAVATGLLSNTKAVFLRSGRECLFVILKALRLRSQSRIGVPLYCCSSVFEAIAAAGHIPAFLDLDLATYSLDLDALERSRERLDALVVVHTFGYPTDLAQVRTCLGGRKIPVIEDCAHALFSQYRHGLLGTHTEASFFSFGLHKPAAVGGGGMAFFNEPSLAKTAREIAAPAPPSRREELAHIAKCWVRGFAYWRPVYGALLASPLGRFRDPALRPARTSNLKPTTLRYSPNRMRRCEHALLEMRLAEFQAKLPALARNTERLRTAIRGTSLLMPEEPQHGKWNHFLLPVRYCDGKSWSAGRQFLLKRRIDTAPLYSGCVRSAVPFGYSGDCPNTEQAARTVCTVPHYASLSDSEIEFLGECLRKSTEVS